MMAAQYSKRQKKVGDPDRDPVLLDIVRRLVEAYQPERIYLFGSRARGEAGPDSDYDILIVIPDDAPENQRRSRLAYEALRGTGVAADVVIWRELAFNNVNNSNPRFQQRC